MPKGVYERKPKVVSVQKAGMNMLYGDMPRFRMGEIGSTGLRVQSGIPETELIRELSFPESMRTFKKMSYDSTISSALTLIDLFLAKTPWNVRAPQGASEERAKFIEECMHDMQHSFADFVSEAGSMVTYGFAIHEKVFRYRTRSAGSKFDDGLIGWSKLPLRSQDTITKFIYTDDGRDLMGVKQNLSMLGAMGAVVRPKGNSEVIIPRSKMLLFRVGKNKENPVGQSPLRNVYYSWKYRTAIEEQEAIGIQRDLSGYPVIKIPPQLMAEDADDNQKAIYQMYQNIIRNMHMNEQAGLILPQAFDPDTKQPLFDFELMGVEGGKSYDTSEIIRRYDNKILTALFADLLIMGQSSTGSFALGSIKNNLLNLAIEARLQEIANVINRDLIPQTFALNGWTDSVYPEVYFDDFTEEDLDIFSRAVQRMASVGMIERDRDMLNKVRVSMGVDPYPDDEPVHKDDLTGQKEESKAGEGFKTAGEGTSKQPSGEDESAANNSN